MKYIIVNTSHGYEARFDEVVSITQQERLAKELEYPILARGEFSSNPVEAKMIINEEIRQAMRRGKFDLKLLEARLSK